MGDKPVTAVWKNLALPEQMPATIYGDRRVSCFVPRLPNLVTLFETAVRQSPQTEALVFEGQRLSYHQLDEKCRRLAAGLSSLGVSAGDRVVLLISNRPEFVISFFAVQLLGAIAVPVSIREQRAGITYMANQCGACVVIGDAELADLMPLPDQAPQLKWRIVLDEIPDAMRSASDLRSCTQLIAGADVADAFTDQHRPHEQDTAVILYTSGTTGRPKGAMLTHIGMIHSAMHFLGCMSLPPSVRCIMAVPASHVTGLVANIITTVAAVGTLIIMREFKAGKFLALAGDERCEFTVLVPAMYKLCLMQPDFDNYDLTHWQVGGYGGAPMPVSTIDELARRISGLRLINAYGATETTSPATLLPAELAREQAHSVGLALPCAQLKVIDDNRHELAPGEVGEICIAGPMVVPGYWDNPEATESEFIDGYWHSGDLGSIDAQGFVSILDRKKDMLNRGGHKIYSVEVENVLMAMPGVSEAAVIGMPCPVLGERVHAVVCADPGQVSEKDLRASCASQLADYKVPESVRVQETPLPRNANGKILKRLLRQDTQNQ